MQWDLSSWLSLELNPCLDWRWGVSDGPSCSGVADKKKKKCCFVVWIQQQQIELASLELAAVHQISCKIWALWSWRYHRSVLHSHRKCHWMPGRVTRPNGTHSCRFQTSNGIEMLLFIPGVGNFTVRVHFPTVGAFSLLLQIFFDSALIILLSFSSPWWQKGYLQHLQKWGNTQRLWRDQVETGGPGKVKWYPKGAACVQHSCHWKPCTDYQHGKATL